MKLIDRNGKVISTGGGEAIASSVDPTNDSRFNPLKLVSGTVARRQRADRDRQAHRGHSSTSRSATRSASPLTTASISSRSPASQNSPSSESIGASTIAIFDVPTAQELFHKVGKFDEIQVAAKTGVTPAELVGEIRPLLPADGRR